MIKSEDIIDVTDLYGREIAILKARFGGMVELLKDSHAILAGGAFTSLLTNREVNDYDLYFVHREGLGLALTNCYEVWDSEYDLASFEVRFNHMTDKSLLAIREEEDVQFILYRLFSGGAPQIFSAFDFTINMFAYDFSTGRMFAHKDAIKHLAQRVLVVNEGTEYPLVSVLRVQKYAERGFTISKAQMIKLLLSITAKSYNSWETVIDEIGSMYGIVAEKLFDVTQPFSISEVQRQIQENEWYLRDGQKLIPNIPSLQDVVLNFLHREDLICPKFALEVLGEFRYNAAKEKLKKNLPLKESSGVPVFKVDGEGFF